ncbi:hypothetical protein BGX27_005495 [Mortierella sp. AM989]|nr:hypothetical protein BGX27_005495 [Mortierella sp. AM989]
MSRHGAHGAFYTPNAVLSGLQLQFFGSFDTTTYNILRQQQDEDFRKKQFHQHQIWQHVQDRLAEQNKILEQEKVKQPKTQSKGNQLLHISPAEALEESTAMEVTVSDIASPDLSISSSSSSSTVTSGSCSPELNPTKRSIRWGLQNNMIKRFDKTSPITLVTVPAIDKRPSKSALKVRTSNIIQKQSFKTTKTTTTTTTTTTATTTSTNNTKTANNTKNGFPSRKRAADFF